MRLKRFFHCFDRGKINRGSAFQLSALCFFHCGEGLSIRGVVCGIQEESLHIVVETAVLGFSKLLQSVDEV